MPDEYLTEQDMERMGTKEVKKWFFQENIRLVQQRQELEQEKADLKRQKEDFKREQRQADTKVRMTQNQLNQEKKLFDMKWKVLEKELVRLAEDKRQIEAERREYQALQVQPSFNRHFELFFIGVNSRESLKKRYKDLIKIFHPDNMSGDKATLQQINKEYDALKQIFT